MFFKRKTLINKLLDGKNKDLYDFVSKFLSLSIEEGNASCYGLYTKGDRAVLYIPKGNYSPSSFAHELLHAELKIKGIHISTKLSVTERPLLIPIFSEALSDHITNVLEHRKMYPKFISTGYKEEDFLSDSLTPILTEVEVNAIIYGIKHNGSYSADGIDTFIGKYLAARCSCFSFYDYSDKLQSLREAEPRLSSILDALVDRWDAYDIEKEGEPLSDSCLLISYDFLNEIEDWVKTIQVV